MAKLDDTACIVYGNSSTKGGRQFGHTALTMSLADYATIPRNVLFLLTAAPGDLGNRSSTGRYETNIQQTCLQLQTGIQYNNSAQEHHHGQTG